MDGPGRAIEFLLSSSDLHQFAARLPYPSTSLMLGERDVEELAARRRALDQSLHEAQDAQRALGDADTRLTYLDTRVSLGRGGLRDRAGAQQDGASDTACDLADALFRTCTRALSTACMISPSEMTDAS